MRPRTDRMIAIAILVGAFLVRLAFVLQTKKLPFYYHPVMDSGFFDQWAAFKKTAGWFDYTPVFREPLYAYFLAGVYTVFRQSLTMARLVQATLGSLTAMMLYSVTRRFYGRLAGILAGVIFALATPAVFFVGELNETTLLMFLLVSSAYLLVNAEKSRTYLNAGLSGLLLGASMLTGFATIVALPAWVAHLLLAGNPKLKRASIAVVVGFVILPVAYQALLVKASEHPLVPLRAAWTAFLGSGRVGGTTAEQHYDVPVTTDQGSYRAIAAMGGMEGQRDALRLARVETGQTLSFGATAAHWRAKALGDLARSPGRYLEVFFTKLGMFWGPSQPPGNIDMRFVSGYSLLLKRLTLGFALIAPLGLVGLVRRMRTLLGLALFVILYSLAVSLQLVSDLDKAVVVPFLAVFGSTVISEVVLGARKSKPAKSASLAAVVVIVGVVLYLMPHSNLDRAKQLVALGDIYRGDAIFDKAQASYEEAIGLSPEMPEAYVALSKIYSTGWKRDQALDVLGRAKGKAELDPRLNIEKASLLYSLSKPDEAIALLRTVEDKYPYEPRLHETLGVSLLANGDAKGARDELLKENDYVGGGFVTYEALGGASLQMGEYSSAVGYLETASKLNPTDPGTAMQLADAYNHMNEYIKACEALSRALQMDPGNLPMRFKFANSLYHAGRFDDALKQFKDLENFDPKNADILVNMGTVYEAMDSSLSAVDAWQKALKLDPANTLARENLKAVGR